jgi:predicted DNA-binding transcriptional regulator AlpA
MGRKRRTVGERLRDLASTPGFEHLQDRLPPEDSSADNDPRLGRLGNNPPEPLPFERPWDKPIVAEFLGVTPSGLDKLVKDGKAPPYFRVGRMLRWRPSVVRDWTIAQEEAATAEARRKAEATTA